MLDPAKKRAAETTPIDQAALREAIRAAHVDVTGSEPSRARLRFAWAHVCHETGGAKFTWCNNLGNIKAFASDSWSGAWCDLSEVVPLLPTEPPTQRAYDSPRASATDYWRLMLSRYKRAVGEADRGDLYNAAVAMYELGYFQQDPIVYGLALERWGEEYDRRWPDPTLATTPRAIVVGVVLALLAAVAWAMEEV